MVALAMLSCGRNHRDVSVAEAGESGLTVEELKAMLPGIGESADEAVFSLVENWGRDELLAQAALDEGLHEKSSVARELARARRMILANAYEQEYILSRARVDTAEMAEYYQENMGEFVREEDEVRIAHLMFPDEKSADSVRALADSIPFDSLVTDSGGESYFSGEEIYYSRDEMHPRLARAAFTLAEGEVYGPIRTEYGFHIVKLIDFAPEGTVRDYELVRERIRDILIEKKYNRIYDEVLDSLGAMKSFRVDSAAIRKAAGFDED